MHTTFTNLHDLHDRHLRLAAELDAANELGVGQHRVGFFSRVEVGASLRLETSWNRNC